MKKFLLLVLATLSITSCVNKSMIRSSSNNASIGSNTPITPNQNEDKYTIRFLNDEGTVISSDEYEFGEMPEAPDTPSKENPLEEYTYTFSGWSPSIALVTADVDYVATYQADAKIGEVVWVDGDGKTLLDEDYAYGSMPNYHGDIPTKTPTDTETYVFNGWSPEISLVSEESTTYTAQFSPIYAKYSIQINCTDCLVNKKKSINEEHNVLSDLTYQFNNTSKETYHYPYKLDVTVDGKASNDYAYDNITGKLNIKLTGNTVINAIADNSCVLMKYKYSSSYPTVEFSCDGAFERVDWGDGTTIDETNKSHTYSSDPSVDQYDIRIFGKLSNVGTTSRAITSINIFHSITSIGGNAFRGCSSIVSVVLPTSITSIGAAAFYNCSSLTSIIIPNSVASIGNKVFFNCPSLTIYCEAESKPSLWDSDWNCDYRPVVWGYVGDGIYNNLKYGVSLIDNHKLIVITGTVDKTASMVIIPSTINVKGEDIPVTSIGDSAFYGYSALTSITIPDSIISIGSNVFYWCTALTSINIPSSVTSIGSNAFSYSALTSINIPSSVTSISDGSFDFCVYLAFVTISDGVTSIGNNAFYNCSSLTSISIPNSVISIGESAFEYCEFLGLLDLSKCDHVVSAGYNFLYSTKSTLQIQVKAALVDQYKSAPYWSDYADKITGV